MKTLKKIVISMIIITPILMTQTVYAWYDQTHRSTVTKAFAFMKSRENGNMSQWAAQFIEYVSGNTIVNDLADKCTGTDYFEDTSIGGWWIGYRTALNLYGLGSNFTSFWHFITMSRPGTNGNSYDGYSYRYSLSDGFWGYNGLIKSGLYNQDVRNQGNAGNGIFDDKAGSGVKDAYRVIGQNGASKKYYSTTPENNYNDYQNIIFEPSSNAAAYWYGKALAKMNADTIHGSQILHMGPVMHFAGDANVPHHVWDTSDNNHSEYEQWVDQNIDSLVDMNAVQEHIDNFKDSNKIAYDKDLKNFTIQEIITFFASETLLETGPLYSNDTAVRMEAGIKGLNASIAVNVLIMEKYILDLYTPEQQRIF